MPVDIIRRSFIALGVTLAVACAPLPHADLDAKAKTFVPTPDRANVYIYRNEQLGGLIRMAVTVNGVERGITRGKTFLLLQLEPGRYTIQSQGVAQTSLTLDVAAGRNYYVWQEVKHTFGTFHYRSLLQLVDEKTGQEGVNECHLTFEVR